MNIDKILFRGKTQKRERWIVGFYCPCVIKGFPADPCIIDSENLKKGVWAPDRVVVETVGQYAGLNDKNNTPIFDGDIARVRYEGKTYVGIIQNDAYAAFMFVARSFGWIPLHDLVSDADIEHHLAGKSLCLNAIEIVGNITDNEIADFTEVVK